MRARLGTKTNARTHGTDEDVPYGEWCRCAVCGLLAQSTPNAEFFGEPGSPLLCSRCKFKAIMGRVNRRRR